MDTTLCPEWTSVKRLKSSLTLDINQSTTGGGGGGGGGRKRVDPAMLDGILSTPDVCLLKLASPELERLVLQQYHQQTTTTSCSSLGDLKPPPTTSSSSSSLLQQQQTAFSCTDDVITSVRSVTDEQETYARGFVDALLELHSRCGTSGQPAPPAITGSQIQPDNQWPSAQSAVTSSCGDRLIPTRPEVISAANGYSRGTKRPLDCSYELSVDTTTSGCGVARLGSSPASSSSLLRSSCSVGATAADTPPISPIDMEQQERIKLERKRARNRVAATRCRNRKLERIDQLQEQSDALRATNARLSAEVTRLRETVARLRQDVLRHSGCPTFNPAAACVGLGTVFQEDFMSQQSPVHMSFV